MKIYIFIIHLIFLSFLGFSQQFEGKMTIVKKNLSDTTFYTYTVKNNMVRIDEFDKYNRLQQYYIINLSNKAIYTLNPSLKIYSRVPYTPQNTPKPKVDIIQTGIYKNINGYKCMQWRVRNANDNIETTYWVASTKYDFLRNLGKVSTNASFSIIPYVNIPIASIAGDMPILIENKTLLRVNKSSMEITDIKKCLVQANVFSIPQGYTLYQTNN